jgi:hypothetical protein
MLPEQVIGAEFEEVEGTKSIFIHFEADPSIGNTNSSEPNCAHRNCLGVKNCSNLSVPLKFAPPEIQPEDVRSAPVESGGGPWNCPGSIVVPNSTCHSA